MGKHANTKAKEFKKLDNLILSGTLLAIDPGSNLMGYSVVHKGKRIDGGVLEGKGKDIFERLHDLHSKLRKLAYSAGPIDVLVVEEIRGKMAHPYLLWAVGMAIIAVGAEVTLEMPITLWRSQIPPDYVKSDMKDAQMIGETVIKVCKSPNGKLEPVREPKIRKKTTAARKEKDTTSRAESRRFSKPTKKKKPKRRGR